MYSHDCSLHVFTKLERMRMNAPHDSAADLGAGNHGVLVSLELGVACPKLGASETTRQEETAQLVR